MAATPSVFVGHGAPTLILEPAPVRTFLAGLADIVQPKAIVVASAHWNTAVPTVGAAPAHETIHDFYGFPQPLYALRYPAAGDPVLARRVAGLLEDAGFTTAIDTARGLDHGAWAPLLLAWPDVDVPVVPLSIQASRGPDHHLAVGAALAPLRADGVLVLASGQATHNLADFRGQPLDAEAAPYARAFDDWLADRLFAGDRAALVDYRSQAPEGARCHPTDEHLLPLFVALGAGGDGATARALHRSFTYGVLSMAAYAFD